MALFSQDIIQKLRREILPLQGYAPQRGVATDAGLGPIAKAFPGGVFPIAAVHEFIASDREQMAATFGFVSGILNRLMKNNGAVIWVGQSSLFPPALRLYNLEPANIVFIDLRKAEDKLWATEEALKCPGIAAVICETSDLDFTASRRLQLAVEQSRVTGFILRGTTKKTNTTACLTRWKIAPIASATPDGLPGVGLPRWQVELVKVRNGKPGTWLVEWTGSQFEEIAMPVSIPERLIKTA